jgi:hypothetical protein
LQNFRTLTVYNFQTAWRTHCWYSSDCAGDYKNEPKMASMQRAISKSQNYKYNFVVSSTPFWPNLKNYLTKNRFRQVFILLRLVNTNLKALFDWSSRSSE